MSTRHLLRPTLLLATGWLLLAGNLHAQAAPPAASAPRLVIHRQADLPRFSYRIEGTATAFAEADAAAFGRFASQVRHDVDRTLDDYQIDDKSTQGSLLDVRAQLQELAGDYAGALRTLEARRALEEKPAARLLSGLFAQARLQAALAAGGEHGDDYVRLFRERYAAAIAPLPWDVVANNLKSAYGYSRLANRAETLGRVSTELDPAVAKSGALNTEEAQALIATRLTLQAVLPLAQARADVLQAFIRTHETPRPDIWPAREVTLTADDRLTPVNVAIWDSGIDVALFPGRVFEDPHPTASGRHGLAFDDNGNPSADWLYPLTAAQRAGYPDFRTEIRGRLDLRDGIDSADARALQQRYATMSPEQMHAWQEIEKVLGFYLHGTHCAGIAARGNPAIRLVVARFDDQLPDYPFAPTEAWVRKMAGDFRQMGDYFRTRHVRVVNMSWGDDPQEFELWLARTGGGADPQARKARAATLFALWRDAVAEALRAAPDTLFVTAAGNSDSDIGFIEDVPASLRLPNLITVGAVDQAGDETSFTSHGNGVLAHSNGFLVDSVVPGGAHLRLSGTSMAAPNVVNLAAKLLALDPSLTPGQTIDLIRRGATDTPDGRRHLIDERRSVDLLKAERLHETASAQAR